MKHKISLLPLLLALVLLLTSCGSAPSAMQPNDVEGSAPASDAPSASTMRLRKTEGTVDVSDGDGKEIAPMDNLDLYGGYQVGTQAESCAWIDLDSVKLTKMDSHSRVEIIKDGKKLELNVKSGSVFFNVTEPLADDETLNIRTSTMLVGIRGTCGWVTGKTVGLLEGAVTVTAGEQTLTVSAGEMAFLTQEDALEVRKLTRNSVPGFVVREILDDDDLKQAIFDASGLGFPTTYEELLSMLERERPEEEIVYSEVIDFEADGSPELLVIRQHDAPARFNDKSFTFSIYRNGTGGIRYLISGGAVDAERLSYISCSLVERDGRLFVECLSNRDTGTSRQYYTQYSGSLAGQDGDADAWGNTDFFTVAVSETGERNMSAVLHDENGFIVSHRESEMIDPGEVDVLLSQYTLVRELYRISYDS